MSFLRPLALPRAATLTRFLSTSPAVQSTTEATSSTTTSSPAASSQSLEYRVSRTPSAQLPIYLLAKRGGNLKQTRVKKIEGNIAQLREDLKVALGIEEDREIQVNHLTRHIIVKVCLNAGCFLSQGKMGRERWFELDGLEHG
jgi:large subunit ribosomal protein L49